jgi:N-carbamoylputrescine amidase
MPDMLSVALLQLTISTEPKTTRQRIADALDEAASGGAQLAILPELHNSPYFCQLQETARFDLAESIDGPTQAMLSQKAKQHGMVIVGSIFERRAAGLYHNTAMVLDADGTLAGIYRKMHIPDDPGFNEKFYFAPGDSDFTPIATRVGRLGVLVCWDQWYPEAARAMALNGAECLIYPTAIGWDRNDDSDEQERQLRAWQLVQRGHAVANNLPVLACNRSGFEQAEHEPGIEFWGHSFVAGVQGEMLAEANTDTTILRASIDRSASEQCRRIWPFLRDRRIDAYQVLQQRFGSHHS